MECNQLSRYTRPSSVNNELGPNKKNDQVAIYLEDKQNTEYRITVFIFLFFGLLYRFFNSGKTMTTYLK